MSNIRNNTNTNIQGDIHHNVTSNIKNDVKKNINIKNINMMKFLQPNTLTREDLTRSVRRYTRLSMKEAAELVDGIIDSLANAILSDKMIKIRLFGIFTTRQKKERVGRNPKTMVEAPIAARTVLKFKPAPTLKKRINANIDGIGFSNSEGDKVLNVR